MKNKNLFLSFTYMMCSITLLCQQAKFEPLPVKLFSTMIDSTTSMDIVMLKGKGGSISVEGKNVRLFNSFFENKGSLKTNASADGNIMWLVNGREFISGSYFLGDSVGCVVFQKEGKEYVNLLTHEGNDFLKSQIKN